MATNDQQIQEVEAMEAELSRYLSSNDAYLVRKYSNRQNFEIVEKVAKENPHVANNIYTVYNKWHEIFNSK